MEARAAAVPGRDGRVWVRATISLPGLPLGAHALVDTQGAYEADCIRAGYLVVVEESQDPTLDSGV